MSDINYEDVMNDEGSSSEELSSVEVLNNESVQLQSTNDNNENDRNIEDEYAAFMNSDTGDGVGENDGELVNIDTNEQAINTLVILQGEEWIVDLRNEQQIHITIKEGICELFGVELAINTEYMFNNQEKLCFLAVEPCKIEYRSNKTLLKPFPDCIVVHDPNVIALYAFSLQLLQKRMRGIRGPRCLVIGDKTSGKTSIAKTLLSYTTKMMGPPSTPLFINLDPTKGIFTLPGTLSATVVNDNLQPESAIWGESLTSSTHPLVPTFEPIIKHFGFEEITQYNFDHYKQLVDDLVNDSRIILSNYQEINQTGLIIDTNTFKFKQENTIKQEIEEDLPKADTENVEVDIKQEDNDTGFLNAPEISNDLLTKEQDDDYAMKSSGQESEYEDEDDYEPKKNETMTEEDTTNTDELIELPYDVNFINEIADKFEVDHIFDICNVDGHSSINNYLSNRIKALSSVVKRAFIYPIAQNKSINSLSLSDSYKRFAQRAAIRAYFYGGTPKFTLSPYTVTVRYEDVHIFTHNPEKCGDLVKIENITKEILQYGILAVTNSDIKEKDTSKILQSGVLGYVLVLSVIDAANKQLIKILSPTMGDLPKRMMILTEYKYYE
ncbi:uncharacterized protein HGUI_04039 [Hanseniaspora guilliermondii]|uniref:Polynucleotide 5'-hydroxyl-kinase GRC3 n=1 Tax=Hanseniaspora guilliermondii TaxID=56406 RepID=A0A1L0FQI3_9ASCO|nr:uncharacterized protein HGUI_04039 [Hanseniaspora guilliermondii]